MSYCRIITLCKYIIHALYTVRVFQCEPRYKPPFRSHSAHTEYKAAPGAGAMRCMNFHFCCCGFSLAQFLGDHHGQWFWRYLLSQNIRNVLSLQSGSAHVKYILINPLFPIEFTLLYTWRSSLWIHNYMWDASLLQRGVHALSAHSIPLNPTALTPLSFDWQCHDCCQCCSHWGKTAPKWHLIFSTKLHFHS
jgi:hypothetical protein